VCSNAFLFSPILFLPRSSEPLHLRVTQNQEDAHREGGLGRKAMKKQQKRQPDRRAPHQCLPVHFLLLKSITILGQLQLLQDFFDVLDAPGAGGGPGPL